MSYAILYSGNGKQQVHATSDDRETIMREYQRIRREAPTVEVTVQQLPTGLDVTLKPLQIFQEG